MARTKTRESINKVLEYSNSRTGVTTTMYPFTLSGNVIMKSGKLLDDVLVDIAEKGIAEIPDHSLPVLKLKMDDDVDKIGSAHLQKQVLESISDAAKTVDKDNKIIVDISNDIVNRSVYSTVRQYGLISSNHVDQSDKLQAAIDAKATEGGGTIFIPDNFTIALGKNITIKDGVKLKGGKIRFVALVQIFMSGNMPGIEQVWIDSSGYGNGSMGVIEFVDSIGARVEDVRITGNHLYRGFLCKTKATDTFIRRCTVTGLGWGILFNDGASEQTAGADYRKIGENVYTGAIGTGIYISEFEFTPGPDRTGDGIEINAPDFGIRKVRIKDCVINGTNATSSNGIGIGTANCTDVQIEGCKVYNAKFDGYHLEKGKHQMISNCYAYRCGRAVGSSHNQHVKVIGNIFEQCGNWFISYNDRSQYQKVYDVLIAYNTFDGMMETDGGRYGVLLSNASNVRILENTFKDYSGSTSTALIQFFNQAVDTVYDSKIAGNTFDKGTQTITPNRIISINDGGTGNEVTGNKMLNGYQSTSVTMDITTNRWEGNARSKKSGQHFLTSGSPVGYVLGTKGATCTDTLTGDQYVGTGTAATGITTSTWDKISVTRVTAT